MSVATRHLVAKWSELTIMQFDELRLTRLRTTRLVWWGHRPVEPGWRYNFLGFKWYSQIGAAFDGDRQDVCQDWLARIHFEIRHEGFVVARVPPTLPEPDEKGCREFLLHPMCPLVLTEGHKVPEIWMVAKSPIELPFTMRLKIGSTCQIQGPKEVR